MTVSRKGRGAERHSRQKNREQQAAVAVASAAGAVANKALLLAQKNADAVTTNTNAIAAGGGGGGGGAATTVSSLSMNPAPSGDHTLGDATDTGKLTIKSDSTIDRTLELGGKTIEPTEFTIAIGYAKNDSDSKFASFALEATSATDHKLNVGDVIKISGASGAQSRLNGKFKVLTVPTKKKICILCI